jgi:hypothetical protein
MVSIETASQFLIGRPPHTLARPLLLMRKSMPRPFELNDDQRSDLHRLVQSSLPNNWRDASAALSRCVEASVSAWISAKDAEVKPQENAHLQPLIQLLTSTREPSIGLVRTRATTLPRSIVRQIEGRAASISASIEAFRPIASDFKGWAKAAPATELISMLQSLLFQAGHLLPGRNRPNGRQSGHRFEPLVMGRGKGLPEEQRKAGGRPQEEYLRLLISFLAVDWLLSTGLQPDKGRSDHPPFGAFVFMVFRWIGEEDKAAHSLRTYWYPTKPRQKKKRLLALSQG